jgi:hypothetical protein
VLRAFLLLLGGALGLTGMILLIRGLPGGGQALAFGGLLLHGTLFERWRYHPKHVRPETDWQPTGERFEDPETGKTVQVFYDPRSGERRYVSDSQPHGS